MRLPMTRGNPIGAASLRFATTLLVLISAISAIAVPADAHRPLPPQVLSTAPGIHPFGKGRHSWWGVRMYDATLWIVGPHWSAAAPHALDIEPGRAVPADTLVKNAIAEMRDLKVGDERQLGIWQAEMIKLIPNVQQGDQIVIFCPDTKRTLSYLNNSSTGEVDDPSFCPALMSVWLHPQTKHQAIRKSLLRH
jgi:Chalcone isomerase-like